MRISTITFIFICFSFSINVATADPHTKKECENSEISNAERLECLTNKYGTLEVKLDNEVAAIIKNLPKSGLWGDFESAEEEKNFYKRREKAILNANKQWKIFSEAECEMVAGVYEGGSGQDTYNTLCKIQKVEERLLYLKSHEPYKSFRRKHG